jgi:LPXTG-motif cell wall-anchored protein
MLFTTFVVITVLCLLIPFTRMYGVLGSVITAYFYPTYTLSLLGVLALAGVAFIYFKRRKSHA